MSPMVEQPEGYDPKLDPIEIVDYDPRWPALYLEEEAFLRRALAGIPGIRLEHIGSTAVPGLAAKPIIDIMAAVDSREDWPRVLASLQSSGYAHRAYAFDENHWFFVKGMPPYGERRTHQVHLWEFGGTTWLKHLAFRDFLRSHEVETGQYEILKRELARNSPSIGKATPKPRPTSSRAS